MIARKKGTRYRNTCEFVEKGGPFMKFLMGMICGLVVAIAVPVVVVVTGAGAAGHVNGLRSKKTPIPHESVGDEHA
jgi:hypothetical protein